MKCPLCSNSILRHVEQGEVKWFCNHCWQTMPDLNQFLSPRILSKNINQIRLEKKHTQAAKSHSQVLAAVN